MKSIFLIAFLGLSLTPANAANPKIEEVWDYYDIKGRTVDNLKSQIRRKGPLIGGKRWGGYPYTSVRIRRNCQISLKIRYRVPRWSNKTEGTANTRKRWGRYIKALKRHEKNHGRHAISAAREAVAANCKGVFAIKRKWRGISAKYDRSTRHGYTEGVRLN